MGHLNKFNLLPLLTEHGSCQTFDISQLNLAEANFLLSCLKQLALNFYLALQLLWVGLPPSLPPMARVLNSSLVDVLRSAKCLWNDYAKHLCNAPPMYFKDRSHGCLNLPTVEGGEHVRTTALKTELFMTLTLGRTAGAPTGSTVPSLFLLLSRREGEPFEVCTISS